ncbi:hypothetical protein DYB32_003306 [Aphanomyces invadans]|uniref:PX domain-containing protein n=1 Tax=Aphanomyces invadans TaxID=157072 RepID=A0A418B0W4_9STRA|nr:hypothetical protein DYB32_003306 [Aphanomyces invadans]
MKHVPSSLKSLGSDILPWGLPKNFEVLRIRDELEQWTSERLAAFRAQSEKVIEEKEKAALEAERAAQIAQQEAEKAAERAQSLQRQVASSTREKQEAISASEKAHARAIQAVVRAEELQNETEVLKRQVEWDAIQLHQIKKDASCAAAIAADLQTKADALQAQEWVCKSNYHVPQLASVKVYRRYSDFVWLHETLCDAFPGLFVPFLPEKHFFNNNSDFVSDRMRSLQAFLREVLRSPDLCRSDATRSFLLLSTEELEKFKATTEKLPNARDVVAAAEKGAIVLKLERKQARDWIFMGQGMDQVAQLDNRKPTMSAEMMTFGMALRGVPDVTEHAIQETLRMHVLHLGAIEQGFVRVTAKEALVEELQQAVDQEVEASAKELISDQVRDEKARLERQRTSIADQLKQLEPQRSFFVAKSFVKSCEDMLQLATESRQAWEALRDRLLRVDCA